MQEQPAESPAARHTPIKRDFGAVTCALLLAFGTTAPAFAGSTTLPTGGSVAAGSASINQSGATLNINQATSQAIINWQTFSVGRDATVNFNQPGASSSTLNRVLGSTPSWIAGRINAPGTVLLVNPNGIVITKSGVINTGGFAASTMDIKDSDYLSGKYQFSGNGRSAGVINNGRINVSDGGFVALLGGQVANNGVISARLGKVGLGAGEMATLDFSGDGFLSVAVPSSQLGKLVDANGALVSNKGKIRADGGQVFLSAATAANILRDAVKVPGSIRANSVGTRNGKIVINGGDGRINISGKLAARGRNKGGEIKVRSAAVDVSGRADASATRAGAAGGEISIIASGTATISGVLKAEGGEGGRGGFIETSGAHLKVADSARISTSAKNGITGTWLIDPNDFTIAASGGDITGAALSAQLAANNVTILSDNGGTAGNGDIFVNDAVSWSSANSLTLNAVRNITVNAAITLASGALNLNATGGYVGVNNTISVTGAGALALTASDYGFAAGSSISFTGGSGIGASLAINGNPYTLLYSMADVQAINASATTLGGRYALAIALDASSTSNWVPLGTDGAGGLLNANNGFTGTFAGLGHTISNLTVNTGASSFAGLFGYVMGGTLRDIGMLGGSVSGGFDVGGLVGYTFSGVTVKNAYATGSVSGSGAVGGLVGNADGTFSNVYATGAVTSSGNAAGGLAGLNVGGTFSNAYATGSVTSSGDLVGGLVGYNLGGTISNSFATGAVAGQTWIGGLAGWSSGTVSNVYAMGAVRGQGEVGGLIGHNAGVQNLNTSGIISNAFATGAVSATGGAAGGLVGVNSYGIISGGAFDTNTAGLAAAIGSDNNGQSGNVAALNTAALQSGGLPAGFSSSTWGGGASGLYPYLKSFFPNGVQAVSGFAYQDAGVTLAASGANGAVPVTVLANGQTLGSATAGANGYYYVPIAAGTVGNSTGVLAYTQANASTGAQNGIGFTSTAASGTIDTVSNLNVYGGYTLFNTSQTTWSGLSATPFSAVLNQAAGANATVAAMLPGLASGYRTTGATFTFDMPLTLSANLYLEAANGDVTIASPITLNGSNALTLTADAGGLYVNAPVAVTGAGSVALKAQPITNVSTAGLVFGTGGSIDYGTTDNGGAFALNGTSYQLVYSMDQLDRIDGVSGIGGGAVTLYGAGLGSSYALATNLDAVGTTYDRALIGSAADFTGKFDGLGHSISNLTIASSDSNVGLFGSIGGVGTVGATVSNLGLVGGSISGGNNVGALAGQSIGTVQTSYSSATVSGAAAVGGLVGLNTNNSGFGPYGLVQSSHASGSVTGTLNTGGLVGESDAAATIRTSYATGAVSGNQNVGGLVGADAGTITLSYATGSVAGVDKVGGLVGRISGLVQNTYSTGAVSGSSNVGPLIGFMATGANLQFSYTTGAASGAGASGFSGGGNGGTFSNVTWDIDTTGRPNVFSLGRTTTQLQNNGLAGLGFNASIWGGGTGGIYPYLKYFFPNGVQAVSGIAYKDAGATIAASGANGAVPVTVLANGQTLGSATTGANGYYYVPVAAGTIGNSTGVLAYTQANVATGAKDGLAVTTTASSGSVSTVPNLNVYGGYALFNTTQTTWSGLSATSLNTVLNQAAGANTIVAGMLPGLASAYRATGGSFTFDVPLTLSSSLYLETSAGDVTIAGPLTLTGSNALTLRAAGDLVFNGNVTVTGAGAVTLTANGDYRFGAGNSLSFTGGSGSGAALMINGNPYTLLYSMADVQAINASATTLGGRYALAIALDASSTSNWVPLGTDGAGGVLNANNGFTGTFAGLGHTISNLTVNTGASSFAGLFGYVMGGTLRDIGMLGGSVSGGFDVGELVGYTFSGVTVKNAYATGSVTGSGVVGGLVGNADGTFSNVYATGAVTSSGNAAGGLAGLNVGGTFSNAYATGSVTSSADLAGGLIGYNLGGTISNSFATGAVAGQTWIGGLAGWSSGTVSNVYAMGAVRGQSEVGGLIGHNAGVQNLNTNGIISNAFATGAVSATGGAAGGLVGVNSYGIISGGAFDTNTAGLAAGIGSDNNGQGGNVAALSTAALQTGGLPAGFDANVWGGGASGLYPYLKSFFPNGVQAVSGFAYQDAGVTLAASGAAGAVTVSGVVNGVGLSGGTTGANGYYYLLAPAGTISGGGSQVIVFSSGATGGATLQQNATGSLSGLNIYGTYLKEQAASTTTTLSSLSTALATALGSTTLPTYTNRQINITASSFTIDQALNVAGTLVLAGGNTVISQTQPIAAATLSVTTTDAAVTLTNFNNNITAIGSVNTGSGGFILTDNTSALTIGSLSAGSVTLANILGDVSSGTISAANDISIDAAGQFSITGAVTSTNGGVSLGGASIVQGAAGTVSAATTIQLLADQMTIAATITGGDSITLAPLGFSTGMTLGNSASPSGLVINNAALSFLNTPVLNIGATAPNNI